MAWWRRNHSLMCRSPIHHYTQRMLRKHDAFHAALRTRGFSRNPSNSAQHENVRDDTNKRPENMSQLEWLQLQHYQRLRKRLVDDPYKTLFGASNDMLSGKGLADWEWIHKSFPKWMLNEMEDSGRPPERSQEKSNYPKNVEIRDEDVPTPGAREPLFAEPAFRKTAFERDASSGIISPSDLRRPRESSYFKVVGASNATNRSAHSDDSGQPQAVDKKPSNDPIHLFATGLPGHRFRELYPADSIKFTTEEAVAPEPNTFESSIERLKSRYAKYRASDHEPTSSEDPTANRSTHGLVLNAEVGDSKAWRQTAVSRRAVRSVDSQPMETSAPVDHMTGKVVQSENESGQRLEELNSSNFATEAPVTRPTSDVLKQLPQDDIDFLSAAEIRATMGAKRSQVPSDEERKLNREKLEQAFTESREPFPMDPMLEAKFIINQHVRREERQMREAQLDREVEDASIKKGSSIQDDVADVSAESSIEKMRKWLENTSASFAKQFWQDPAEHSNVTEMKTYYDGTASRVKKGQAAIRAIVEDLEKDVPASKALLKRLRNDEEQLDSAIHMLRRRSSNGDSHVPNPRKTQSLGSLETRFNQTNTELEKAYIDLRDLVGTEAVTDATDSFKRRLTTSSEVLQKNTQLLRVLGWSLQRRREHPNIDSNILSDCRVVTDNLLSLRDTQMALVRLLDRAMLVYGVLPNTAEAIDAAKAEHSQHENCEDPFVRARLAADAHLINEIKAHKTVAHEPAKEPVLQPATSDVLDLPNPLAHSLFRPFGPVVEKLGSKEYQEHADKVNALEEASGSTDAAMADGAIPKPDYFQMLRNDPSPIPASLGHDIPMPMTDHKAPYCFVSSEARINLRKTNEAADKSTTSVQENETPAVTELATSTSVEPEAAPTDPTPESIASTSHLPTHYTILVRDPQTDTLSITTSTTGPPRDTSPTVPLHQALSALDSPAKFIPYITAGLEVVSAKNDILVLRDTIDSPASIRPFETVQPLPSQEDLDTSRGTTNPIDGTTRLSPTGYVGPEESAEQLEKEFEERRQAAGRMSSQESVWEERSRGESRKAKKEGGAGGVVKTAIWVAGMCYVAGVIGEILT